MDHLSVVLVHFNSDKETTDCLKSLSAISSRGFKYNVVVVDNGSKVPYHLHHSFEDQPFEVVRSESNLGFTGGNNLGIQFALQKYLSDYVVLLNSDTTVDSEFLTQLYLFAKKNPRSGLISPKILFYPGREYHAASYKSTQKGTVLWYGGGSLDWPNLVAYHRGVDEIDRGHFDTQTESDFATGCCVIIRREVLEKIGLLDERFFLYLEDVDLSVRAKQMGYEIGFCATSVVWHKNAGSTGGAGSPLQTYYQTRNRLLFGLKHGTLRQQLATVMFLIRLLKNGTSAERVAVTDLLMGQLGKRVVI